MNDRTILRDQESEAKYALLSRPFLSRQFRQGGLSFSPHIRQTADDTAVYGPRTILATVGSVEYAG